MAERVTKSEVYGAFRQLCKDLSIRCRDDIPEPDRYTDQADGSWYLEYVTGKGYRIEQVAYYYDDEAEEDGLYLPFGLQCRPAKEMFDTIRFGVQLFMAISLKRRARKEAEAVEATIRKLREKRGQFGPALPSYWRNET